MIFDFAKPPSSDAAVAIVGIPLDRTSSFIPGTRFGPEAARVGSQNIESFSPYLLRDAAGLSISDCGDIALSFPTREAPLDQIREATSLRLQSGTKQLAVGGEHTITPAIVSVLAAKYPDLCVIQFDAHSDLREEFLGEKWCHATAMARVLDYVPRSRLFQLGIRSFSHADEMTQPGVFPFEVMSPAEAVRKQVGSKPVYLSLDVDVLDPSVLPDVQTPEPGGVGFRELVLCLAGFARLDVVGADVVEFCPRGPLPTAGSALVAELVRELAIILNKD